ncbi:pyridoxal 5'-phosphate synthase glutaminase subunit PdxT [Mitsuokella multacida]|uniref:Pyridoxal 5'-phosphate synthase subunit PdxT n=1 Tax=Mitsuokella multacida DSM 20544 TaxID=500635 RepID=C9KL91_9FIRM|nr:pyridoxal 5'-phosphate synthase glutaminase subunit PdxT [Mitsuokella multacida]EEX69369.1 pyridoxal 5'-phosphate synthase, glutaminase subunit Pdx2 [Mitsuokella multacida DSM 20544]
MAKRIGVLAVQGAFAEHEAMLGALGAVCHELRKASDLEEKPDGLVLPGGESTVQRKILMESGMFSPIRSWIGEGMPVLATCAGLILLAEHLSNDARTCFETLPVTVRRNAYGRQLGSFIAEAKVRHIGTMRQNFIRAPYIEQVSPEVEVLSETEGHITAVRYKNQLALSFHPEVGHDTRLHEAFLRMI